MNDIGNRIKKLRIDNKYTQTELGEKLFFSDKTISSWESNRTKPDLNSLCQLSKILNCPIAYLLYGDEQKNNIETELKFKIDKEEFNRLLNKVKNSSELIEEINQKDFYYEIPNSTSKWLRIREHGNKFIFSYKELGNKNSYNKYEVTVDNKDNLEKIINSLGFSLLTIVNKKRITYLYNNKYEISFDSVENLGLFIEIEINKYDAPISEEYDNLIKVATNLSIDLRTIEMQKYPELITLKDYQNW